MPEFESLTRETIEMVKRMAWIAEYRDAGTPFHLERIRGYVLTLAQGLGLPAAEAELYSVAAMLHDIGKAGLVEGTLGRTGSLSQIDIEAAKKHTGIGYDILKESQVPVLQTAAAICLSHHERWDGLGYPRRLHGEQIPLTARLTGLADVFDALTTPRAYKQEVSLMEAREILREASGQYFDPSLVQVLVDHLDALAKVRQLNL